MTWRQAIFPEACAVFLPVCVFPLFSWVRHSFGMLWLMVCRSHEKSEKNHKEFDNLATSLAAYHILFILYKGTFRKSVSVYQVSWMVVHSNI